MVRVGRLFVRNPPEPDGELPTRLFQEVVCQPANGFCTGPCHHVRTRRGEVAMGDKMSQSSGHDSDVVIMVLEKRHHAPVGTAFQYVGLLARGVDTFHKVSAGEWSIIVHRVMWWSIALPRPSAAEYDRNSLNPSL
jgi:hypothetical protein